MRRGSPRPAAPADKLLELIRERGADGYRCDADRPGQWTARCPSCGDRVLDITEHGYGGHVSVRCAHGCDADDVLRRLTHPDRCSSCGTRYDIAGKASDVVALATEQQRLLRQLVPCDPHLVLAA